MTNIIPVAGTPGLHVIEGEYIALKPLAEALGLQAHGQAAKLKEKSWAGTQSICVPTNGGMQKMSGGFGRKLANLYRMEFGEEPPVEQAEVRLRAVKAYKESHRYLFDQVLETCK